MIANVFGLKSIYEFLAISDSSALLFDSSVILLFMLFVLVTVIYVNKLQLDKQRNKATCLCIAISIVSMFAYDCMILIFATHYESVKITAIILLNITSIIVTFHYAAREPTFLTSDSIAETCGKIYNNKYIRIIVAIFSICFCLSFFIIYIQLWHFEFGVFSDFTYYNLSDNLTLLISVTALILGVFCSSNSMISINAICFVAFWLLIILLLLSLSFDVTKTFVTDTLGRQLIDNYNEADSLWEEKFTLLLFLATIPKISPICFQLIAPITNSSHLSNTN